MSTLVNFEWAYTSTLLGWIQHISFWNNLSSSQNNKTGGSHHQFQHGHNCPSVPEPFVLPGFVSNLYMAGWDILGRDTTDIVLHQCIRARKSILLNFTMKTMCWKLWIFCNSWFDVIRVGIQNTGFLFSLLFLWQIRRFNKLQNSFSIISRSTWNLAYV